MCGGVSREAKGLRVPFDSVTEFAGLYDHSFQRNSQESGFSNDFQAKLNVNCLFVFGLSGYCSFDKLPAFMIILSRAILTNNYYFQ